MRVQILVLLIIGLFLIQIANAEIILSQPSGIYNLGDDLGIKATIKNAGDTKGIFDLNLICLQENNFYRIPLSLKAGDQKIIETYVTLTKALAGNGSCNVKAIYAGEEKLSQGFIASSNVNINLVSNEIVVETGKSINIKGTATKDNGKPVNGFAEVSIENLNLRADDLVKNGSFSLDFALPENAKSGVYTLKIRVYEKYNNEESNNGRDYVVIHVKQTPKKIEIAIKNQSIQPEQKFDFKATILDQADDKVEGIVAISIYNTGNKAVYQKILDSDAENNLILESNSTPGYWKIKADFMNLSNEKSFVVEEYQKADFSIADNILTIKNIGNVPYIKQVQISIGNYSEVKNINLELEEDMKLKLSGDGNYEISISDGTNTVKTGVSLTGGVVGVIEVKSNLFKTYAFVWVFLVLVAGMFVITLFRRGFRKQDSYPAEKRKPKEPGVILASSVFSGDKDDKIVREAEHVVVLDGRKENSSVAAVKLKNYEDLKKSEIINAIADSINKNKGSVYINGNFIIGVFASPTTKTFENDRLAVKAAEEIARTIKEKNSNSKIQADFGIGLNSGELIVKKADKLKFTTIGNTLSLARKIAEISQGNVLLSENIYNKVMAEIKAEKVVVDGLNMYNMKSMSDRDRHSDFIHGFLDRQRS